MKTETKRRKNILSLRKVLILMSVSEMYLGTGKKQNTRLHIGIMSKAAVTHQNSQ